MNYFYFRQVRRTTEGPGAKASWVRQAVWPALSVVPFPDIKTLNAAARHPACNFHIFFQAAEEAFQGLLGRGLARGAAGALRVSSASPVVRADHTSSCCHLETRSRRGPEGRLRPSFCQEKEYIVEIVQFCLPFPPTLTVPFEMRPAGDLSLARPMPWDARKRSRLPAEQAQKME